MSVQLRLDAFMVTLKVTCFMCLRLGLLGLGMSSCLLYLHVLHSCAGMMLGSLQFEYCFMIVAAKLIL
jgi:hypothetical protein